jgi:hypothetical protein
MGMTIKELIKQLSKLPGRSKAWIEVTTEYSGTAQAPVESVEVTESGVWLSGKDPAA